MKRDFFQGSCRVAVGLVLVGAVSAAAAQSDTLYVTNGDGSRLAIVQGGVLQSVATTHNKGYPIAVRDTIWIGDYSGFQPNAIEYDLNGNATGNSVLYTPHFAVDGAVNGKTNYQLGDAFSSNATVYSSDADWQNETVMWNVSGTQLTGITYDPVNNSIWISDQTTIYEYDLAGNMLSSFGHSEDRGCLAYEMSTDTLWHVKNGTDQITQFSKTGSLLQTLMVSGLASNNWGAEFTTGAAADCLDLVVSPLVSGQRASWDVDGATPSSTVAIIWGLRPGETVLNGFAGYCATFGIGGVNQSRVIGIAKADANGHVTVLKSQIPNSAQGLRILSQAAERDTCPNECVSNIDDQVVG